MELAAEFAHRVSGLQLREQASDQPQVRGISHCMRCDMQELPVFSDCCQISLANSMCTCR